MKELNQLDLLTILYIYAKSYHAYVYRIEPMFFEEKYRNFFCILQNHYKKFGLPPDKSVFEVELEGDEKDNALKVHEEVVGQANHVKNFAHDYIIEKLDSFVKKCVIKKFLINGYDLYERGEFDKIIRSFTNLNDALVDNDMGEEYHEKEFFDSRYDSDEVGYVTKSGITQFDDTFGGWHNKTLNVIAGPSNSGKTLWLINFVSRLLLNTGSEPHRILYVTLEIDKEQVGRRIDACVSGTPMRELWSLRDVNVRELIARSKDMGNRVIIKEMPAYKTTPSDIEAMMRNLDLTSQGELKPTMVIVDYLGLMMPTHMNKNMGLYEKGLGIAVELRGLAQTYGVPFIVAAQTNRSSFEDRIGQDKISDSIGISQTADMLMTINRNEEDDRENHVKLYVAKSRFSKNGDTFIFKVDYDCMRAEEFDGGPMNGDENK